MPSGVFREVECVLLDELVNGQLTNARLSRCSVHVHHANLRATLRAPSNPHAAMTSEDERALGGDGDSSDALFHNQSAVGSRHSAGKTFG